MKRAYRVDAVRAAEAPLLEQGVPLMENAAYALAIEVIRHLKAKGMRVPGSTVMALVGQGNNGGDALYASATLARRGMAVTAVCFGSVHSAGVEEARRSGVTICSNPSLLECENIAIRSGVWLDGLVGIGACGALREPLATVVRALEQLRAQSAAEPFVVAVDVPSGVGVDTGTLPGAVMRADVTVTMGCAKRALFLPPACHAAGRVVEVSLGFEPYLPARPALATLTDADVRDLWIVPDVNDHKYTRGVLGVIAGSATYPGAGHLCVAGARAVGTGMIRYLGGVDDVVRCYPDLVHTDGRVQAWALGSGLDCLSEASRALHSAVTAGIPVVCDARALELVYADDVPSTVILTPHEGELQALLAARGENLTRESIHAAPARAARLAATLTGATVMLKGSVTVIAAPHGSLYAQPGGPAWLATAGAGDVLTGIVGALLAMHGESLKSEGDSSALPAQLAAAASLIHASAAHIAAHTPQLGHPITALDVAQNVQQAIFAILNV